MEGSSKREISELHRLSLGQSILIEYQLDGPDSEDSRIILERCTLDHSDFTNAQFILVENGQVMGSSCGRQIFDGRISTKITWSKMARPESTRQDVRTNFCRPILTHHDENL